ncbi:endo-1,4-beta-xylanase [Aureobasidium pullulans]|uniref:Beta-xylanase n=1 Tax=Aureobasidium pullulans TaxID=5580 RepID=A0A4S9TA08_AURPU|nr:endo-1,4-beta-xylanase [Aureobasidium pullulans]THZ40753.1 endo-1,4-beta-xylanase [Aureobasidium pullulans]
MRSPLPSTYWRSASTDHFSISTSSSKIISAYDNMHLPSITAALALIGISAATPTDTSSSSSKDQGLAQAWTSKGRQYIGTALTIRDDPIEQGIIQARNEFNSITPENAMKWESTEPSRNNFTFAGADAIIDFADKYKKEVRCHTLVWHSQLPAWVSEGNFDNKTLISIMENHIKKLAGRYKNKCTHWDVVNEALEEDGTYRKSVFYNTIGEAFIPIAFRLASKYAGSHTKLYYNDYNLEYNNNKTLGALRILKLVQSYGVQIDGVGLQAHLTSEATASSGGGVTPDTNTLTKVLKGFTDLGVEVAYTELDVRFTVPVTEAKLKVQADAYARVVQSCINIKKCVGITIWGVSDKYSWIPGVFKTEGAALLWDEQFNKKPAYYSVLKTIQAWRKT